MNKQPHSYPTNLAPPQPSCEEAKPQGKTMKGGGQAAAADASVDILSESSAAASIKRSFEILRNMQPRFNKYVHRRRYKPDFFPGVGTKEFTQEEKDSLTAFVNKHILGKRAEREEDRRVEKDRGAKKRRSSDFHFVENERREEEEHFAKRRSSNFAPATSSIKLAPMRNTQTARQA